MLLETLRTCDPDELAEGLRRWELPFRQLGVAITLGVTALTLLAFYTLSRPQSSVRLSYGDASAEFRRD
jgi:hypothetical protein